MKKCCILLAILCLCGLHPLLGQSVTPVIAFNSAGGSYGNGNGYWRFEWSLGESAVVETFSPADSSLYLTQGVLQPVTDKAKLSPYIAFFAKGEYYIFPNPTSGRFEVNFSVRQAGRLELQLTDHAGRVLQQKVVRYNGWGYIAKFDLSPYANGTYFVIATLTPDPIGPDNETPVARHSGFRIVKVK